MGRRVGTEDVGLDVEAAIDWLHRCEVRLMPAVDPTPAASHPMLLCRREVTLIRHRLENDNIDPAAALASVRKLLKERGYERLVPRLEAIR